MINIQSRTHSILNIIQTGEIPRLTINDHGSTLPPSSCSVDRQLPMSDVEMLEYAEWFDALGDIFGVLVAELSVRP